MSGKFPWSRASALRRILPAAFGTMMVILVVLLAVLQYRRSEASADTALKQSAAISRIARFDTAIRLYAQDHRGPPTTRQGLNALVHQSVIEPKSAHWKRYLPDLNEIPLDPWGHPYIYQTPGSNGEPYFILSYGKDGRPAGWGDDADISSHDGDATDANRP